MSALRSSKWQAKLAAVPLPALSLLVGILCGLLMWLVLEPIQDRRLANLFHDELVGRLDVRAVETRQRFEHFLQEWRRVGSGLSNHWRIKNYLGSTVWHESRNSETQAILHQQTPEWLDPGYPKLNSIEPKHVVLLDNRATPREIYQKQPLSFDLDQLFEFYSGRNEALVTLIDQVPYLLVWSNVSYLEDDLAAVLLLIVPVDDQFLLESQSMTNDSDTLIALVDANTLKLLSSSNREMIARDSHLNDWHENYLLTSQAITRFQSMEQSLLFTTLVSRDAVEETILSITKLAQQDRVLATLVYIIVFSVIFYLISAKISHVLVRISRFGQQALGIEQPVTKKGNQLLLLEDWVKAFFRQLISARDTLRNRQEERLRETEVLKSALFDNSMVSIVTLNQEGIIVEVNSTAFKTFGYNRSQLIGRHLEEMAIHPNDRERFRAMLTGCISMSASNSKCRGQAMQAVTVNGEEKSVECSVISIHLHQQTVFNVYLRDISGQKQAQREITSLAKLASENPSPVLRINKRGVIVYANAASEPLMGYWDCERGQTLPLYWKNLVASSLREGTTKEYEVNLDSQIFSLQLAPILELEYVNIYGRDITRIRMAEMQSRQHQSELVHVCRLSTMGEMSTGLAHELNQPLSAIVNFASGCVRRLQSGKGDEPEIIDAIAQITAQAERAGEIIKRLRTLVGKRPQEHEVVNLNHLVLEVASFIEFEANRQNVEVILELSEGALPVEVDLVQIEQVMLNLVRNAIDAMKQVDQNQRRLVLKTGRMSSREVQVLVQDSGSGIPEQTQKHLFDAFFSTKKSGMGMGLPISQKIMQDHKGVIEVESEYGHGATFRLVLPSDPTIELPGF
ncbi:MAG: PAS domain S-box protein [Candidatus Thiodiazotropha sp. (ex. Lucinisca nassula)]|nr:PAS domain S-box protein [Candidatus Thiodiazotropha sp. (ex. Lucinisca nassula)]